MTIPTLSTLPTAPARTDAPATFVTRADAFLAALVTFQSEMNTSIGAMNTDIASVNANVTLASEWAIKNDAAVSGTDWSAFANASGASPTGSAKAWATTAQDTPVAGGEYSAKHYSGEASDSATAAASSATAAANTANAAMWVSGQSYAEGDNAISGVNYKTYRANTATSGTTDPSASSDWVALAYNLPSQTGNSGKFLTTNGTDESWGDALPSQTGNAGKVLTTDGSNDTWEYAVADQSGQSGKYLTTDGSTTSWATVASVGGGGTTTALPATLTSSSVAAHSLTATGWGETLTLPDATTLSKGGPIFILRNESHYDVAIKNDGGQIINWLYGGQYTICTLTDNSTANGTWSFSLKNIVGWLAADEIDTVFTTSIYHVDQKKLSNDKWFILIKHSTSLYGIVYDESARSFGSMTLISTNGSSMRVRVNEVSTDKVITYEQTTTNGYIVVLSISGTTITVGSSTSATFPATINNNSNFQFKPIGNDFILANGNDSSVYLLGVSVSGTTPSVGSFTTISRTGTVGTNCVTLEPYSGVSNQFVLGYYGASSTYYFANYTLSGTTITAVASASTSCNSDIVYIFPEMSDGRRFIRLRQDSSTIKYCVLSQTASTLTLSTSTITPARVEVYIEGWWQSGTTLVAYSSDTANDIAQELAINTTGTCTTDVANWKASYGAVNLGPTDDGLWVAVNDFQQYEFMLCRLTHDGAGNAVRVWEEDTRAENTTNIPFWSQPEESRLIAPQSAFMHITNGSVISKTYYYQQESDRYQQLGHQMKSGQVQTGFFDKDEKTFVMFDSRRAWARNYDYMNNNISDGDFSKGWDVYAYQVTDNPSSVFSAWLKLRKVCDA